MRELKQIEKKLGTQFKALHQAIALLDDKSSRETILDKLNEHIRVLGDSPDEHEKASTEGKLQELESSLVNSLVQKYVDASGQAEKLDITWLNHRVKNARITLEKSEDTLSALDFIIQAQKIHQYASNIRELDNYCKGISVKDPIVIDLIQLTESEHFQGHLYKKLMNHIHAPEIEDISKIAGNKLVPQKAISILHRTLYDMDIKHNKEDKLYFAEMVKLVRLYCQEMKKDYTKDSPKRYSDGIVKLLAEYRKHRADLTAETLGIIRTNMSYTGLGTLGAVTFNIKNGYQNPEKQTIEPNNGQIDLARAIDTHSKKSRHHCVKHEAEKAVAWERLKDASDTSQQVTVLRDLAHDIRQQHRSKSQVTGFVGNFFRRSKLANQIEQEADQLELAVEKASL